MVKSVRRSAFDVRRWLAHASRSIRAAWAMHPTVTDIIPGTRHAPILLLLTLLSSLAAAEARLELPDPLIPATVMEGRVVLENAAAGMRRVVLPQVDGIEWQVQGRTAQQTSIINGKRSSSEIMALSLRVAKAGTYQIPAATIHLGDGSSLTTAPLTVTVKQGDANLTGEAVAEASFEPDTIVPGQPTTLVYRVLLRQERLRAVQEKPQIGPPAEAISLGEMTTATGTTYDAAGNQWTVRTWRWPITFARPGTYPVTGQQTWYLCRRGFLNDLEAVAERQVAVKPATLTVTAMPGEGRPADFTGLIGAITVTATLDRSRIATGEGAQLSVTYRGRGVELLGRPAVPAIAGITVYPKEDDDKAPATAGERSFRWDVVPATAGTVTIPAFSVPFFDPASRTYRRGASEPLALTVIPGRARSMEVAGSVAPATTAASSPAPAAVSLTGIAALPTPLRGAGATAIPWRWCLSALIAGGVLGLAIGGAGRLVRTLRRGPHRGRVLAEAVASGDLERIAAALHQLVPALHDEARRSTARRLLQAVDVARFGRQPLPADALAMARELEDVA